MGLYFENDDNQNQTQDQPSTTVEEKKEAPKKQITSKKEKEAKILKTKHVYTEEETKKLLEKANEINKKNYSIENI